MPTTTPNTQEKTANAQEKTAATANGRKPSEQALQAVDVAIGAGPTVAENVRTTADTWRKSETRSREIETLQQLGMQGAVVGTMGYASPEKFKSADEAPFKVQRFDIPEDETSLAQLMHGVERFKQIIRGVEV